MPYDTADYAGGRALLERARAVLGPMGELVAEDTRTLYRFGMEAKVPAMMSGAELGPRDLVNDRSLGTLGQLPEPDQDWMMAELDRVVRRVAIHKMWAKSKAVYAMHPHLLRYLASGSVERGLPVAVLDRLRRPNPFLLMPPTPLPRKVASAVAGTVMAEPLAGLYVFGKWEDGTRMCDTNGDRRDALGLQFLLASPDTGGAASRLPAPGLSQEANVIRATVPLDKTFNVDGSVAATLARFQFGSATGLPGDHAEALRTWLPWAVRQALLSILYLCTDGPDIVEYRRGTGKTTKGNGKRAPRADSEEAAVVQEVGFRLGPTWHAARVRYERAAKTETAPEGTGRRMPPHYRGAALNALYWTGPGGAVPAFRERRETFVHADELAAGTEHEGPATVIPVR